MKKTIITAITVLSVVLTSCNKDKFDGAQPKKDCNCGIITNDEIYTNPWSYTLTVKNNCSNRSQTFGVSQSVWMDGKIGKYICFDNNQAFSWRQGDSAGLNVDSLRTVKNSIK